MSFDESNLEDLIMDEFESRGYEHINGKTIERNTKQIILMGDLEMYLFKRYSNQGITEAEIRAIAGTFASFDQGSYVNNRTTFRNIRNGFAVKRLDKKKTPLWVELIDFRNPDNNIFKIVNQYEIQGSKIERIPDAIVFINGIPLVVLEFKSAVREEATIYNAYEQINTRYTRDIPDLFVYNAFTVISDGINSKIGTHFSDYENYYSWNKVNNKDEKKVGFDSLDTMLDGVFTKARLLSIIEDFIYFPDESGKELKVVCRYPQYFGAKMLLENIKQHMLPDGDGKGGTYFGTTGCGKSFTMLFLTRLLMRSRGMSNPTVILITDRNNLDHQLHQQFVVSKRFLMDDKVQSIGSRAELKSLLTGIASGGVFLTTIQKFEEGESALSERNNIIVISDEAHRSQLNMEDADIVIKGQKKHVTGFARILHDSFPNATYVGFTGTPIDETLEVFGPIVDQYTMVESERDNITSKLVYEGRASKVALDPEQMKAIEDYYTKCAEAGSNEYQIDASKREMAKMEVVIGNDKRISNVAKDFVAHYEKRVADGATVEGKALFVCTSRLIAYKLYRQLRELRPEWFEVRDGRTEGVEKKDQAKPSEMVKMVATRGKDDPKEMYDLLGDDDYRKGLETEFKNINSNFKIAIVVDMWLTGFDVPSLDTIYIDKPIQKHSLIQAISRVNRIYPGKENGLIVDYLGIRKELDAALKKYTNDFKPDGFETSEDFVVVMKEYLSILDGMVYSFDPSDYYGDDERKQMHCLTRAMEFVQQDKEFEKKFMTAVRKLKTAYNNCTYSDNVSSDERNRIYFYTAVRSLLVKITKPDAPDTAIMNKKVAELLNKAIQSDEVVQLMTASEEMEESTLDLLSDEYLERIKKIPGLNTKFKLLERLAKITISSYKRTNKLKADQFSDKFDEIVKKYNDRHFRADDIAQMVEEMLVLIAEMQKEDESGQTLGISKEEKAFYDILEKIIDEYQFEFDRGVLPEMARRLKKCTDETCSVLDWKDREDIKAELKMNIILVMEEFGFPPVYYDGVYKQVFEQMETYKKYSE